MSDDFWLQAGWVIDNAASFAPYLAVGFFLLFLFFLLSRSPRVAALCLLAAAPFAVLVSLTFAGAPVGACATDLPRLRVASVNLLEDNRNTEAVLDFVRTARPDVIAFQEAGNLWRDRLDPLYGDYPYRAQSQGGATRLFSNRPFLSAPTIRVVPAMRRAVSADIDVAGTPVTVIASHFLKPDSPAAHRHRRNEMDEVGALVGGSAKPTLLMGDFNAAPTSRDFRALIAAAGFAAPATQIPPVSTWPSRVDHWGIQIDHILATPPFVYERLAAGPRVGSNHRPILADLAVDPGGLCAGAR